MPAVTCGVVDALVGAEDDRSRLAAGAELGEVLLEHVEAVGAVGVGDVEGVLVGGADRAGRAEDDDQRGEPEADGGLAVVEAPGAEAGEPAWPAGRVGLSGAVLALGMSELAHGADRERTAVEAGCVPVEPRWLNGTGVDGATQRASWDSGRSGAERHVVQIRLLGGVSVAADDGEPVDVGPAKCQAVLAALALSPGIGRAGRRAWCALVWGDEPPRTADKTLQSYVTRLRKELGADSIVRTGAAYRLDVDAGCGRRRPLPAAARRRRRRGGARRVDGHAPRRPRRRGPDAGGRRAGRAVARRRWRPTSARRVEADPAAAIGPLTELTADHPFREGLWALLMTALYRVGRQADALAAYRRARAAPRRGARGRTWPRLRELEALILGQDEQLGVNRSSMGSALSDPSGTVTFGFSDVEDSTRLWARTAARSAAAMARHRRARHGRGRPSRRLCLRDRWRLVRRGLPPCRRRRRVGRASCKPPIAQRTVARATSRSGCGSACTRARPRSAGRRYFGPAVIVAAVPGRGRARRPDARVGRDVGVARREQPA